MNYTFVDLGRLLVATALALGTILLPGVAIADTADVLHFRAQRRWAIALVAGLTLLPALESTVAKYMGLDAALALALALAVAGLVSVVRRSPHPRVCTPALIIAGAWLAVVAFETVDFDTGEALHQSFTVIDMVKHAATVQAIVDTGAPPTDAFFARGGTSGYYYFFYTLGAVIVKLAPGLVDARAAIGALMVLVGPALHGLVVVLLERTGYVEGRGARSLRLTVLLLLLVSGLDLLPIAWLGLSSGHWVPQLDMWNEAVVSFTDALLWVPHHVTGVLAAWLGFLSLSEAIAERERGGPLEGARIAVASVAFVSSAGMSVWTTLVAVLAALLWYGTVWRARRWHAVRVLSLSGALTLLLGSPHVLDVMARADLGAPLALTVRAFDQWDVRVAEPALRLVGRLLLLPLNYSLELGMFMLGAVLFWIRRARGEARTNEVARLLTLYAAAGFFFATFTRSTVLLNDIAWRAPMGLQLAMLVWTAAVLQQLRRTETSAAGWGLRALSVLAVLGFSTTLYGVVAQRAYVRMPVVPWASYVNAHPETDRALREAYEWMGRALPASTVTQHNPAPPRVFDFGLYGKNRVGVADRQASLYGASKREVEARVQRLEPLFTQTLAPSEVRRRADEHRVEQLIVTEHDAPWQDKSSWVWRTSPSYENSRVRIIATARLPAGGRQPAATDMARSAPGKKP